MIFKPEAYVGLKFGKLTIFNVYRKSKLTYAECICNCGETYSALLFNIKKDKSSCGKCQANNKFHYNESFFTKSTPERNYVLGLLGADGNIEKNKINLCLKAEDKDVLFEINKHISDQVLVKRKNVKHKYPQYLLRISSKAIVKILDEIGIRPNKSRNFCVPPDLKNDRDFWRGMIDGDGYVSITNGNKLVIGLCGTIDVCEHFLEFCRSYTNTNVNIYLEPSSTNSNFARCRINCSHALTIGHILYDDSTLKIDRKYKIFKKIAAIYNEIRSLQMDKVFMNMALQMSTLSRAVRAKVGAVIVDDKLNIISSAFNGTPAGFDNSAEYELPNGTLKTKPETLHAESNAILKLSRSTLSSENSTMYVTLSPCLQCAKMIIQANIKKVLYKDRHTDADGMVGIQLLKKANIAVEQITQ